MDKYYEAYGGDYDSVNHNFSHIQSPTMQIPETTNRCEESRVCEESRCCGAVMATTEPTCTPMMVAPKVVPGGKIVVKVPVVLAELKVQIPIIADITLREEAVEIKRIKKNVFVTQCKILPQFMDGKVSHMAILSIEGFVRKNIEFATRDCNNEKVISGNIQHTIVKVPFSCITPVTFARVPVLTRNAVTLELEFFEDRLKSCDQCAEHVIGKEPCEQDFFNSEFFNEKIFCELVKADTVEADIHKDVKPMIDHEFCKDPTEQVFKHLKEKIVVTLTLKVLQNQQVKIESLGPDHCECDDRR